VQVEPDWSATLTDANARLHLYGKCEPRPGRKMGHLTVVGETSEEVASRAFDLRATMT
jgi:5-(carboxyamino)imidazole ribonucleotide synthase